MYTCSNCLENKYDNNFKICLIKWCNKPICKQCQDKLGNGGDKCGCSDYCEGHYSKCLHCRYFVCPRCIRACEK